MSSAPDARHEGNLDPVISGISSREKTVIRITEEQLWCFAKGVLNPSEQKQLMRLIARSPEAQAELVRIRESLEAAVPEPVVNILEAAKDRIRRAFHAIGRGQQFDLGASLITQLRDRVVAVLGHGALEPSLVPFMDDKRKAEKPVAEAELRGPERIDISGPERLTVSLLSVSAGRVDIRVYTDAALAGQQVELFELERAEGGGEQARLFDSAEIKLETLESGEQRGTATFEECPPGVLKIVAPDDREIVFYI